MKRFVALVLALVLCFALIPAASAAESLTQNQKAVLETAYAYYLHNPHIQYDSNPITNMQKYSELLGDIRGTDYTSPEMAVEDDLMFSVCSMYCFEVYYDAFGYEILGRPIDCKTSNINHLPTSDINVVYRWDKAVDTGITREQAAQNMAKVLQPGDVINGGSPGGHAMLYVGEILGDGVKYILHCAGGKYDITTGTDNVEGKGAIRLDKLDSYVLDPKKGLIFTGEYEMLTVLRPLNEIGQKPAEFPMTASAKGRLQYSRLGYHRTADYNKYTAVPMGEDITVTIRLENKSAGDYTVPVTEVVPAGTVLKEGSVSAGGTVNGKEIKWNVELKAGEEKSVSYTVTVTAARGETIKLEGGNAGGIKSNSIPVLVGGKGLSAQQQKKLADITKKKGLFNGQTYTDTDFAQAVYRNILQLDVEIPTTVELLEKAFVKKRLAGASGNMYLRAETIPADFTVQAAMQVPFYFGGKQVRTGGSGSRDRILDFKEHQLQVGDVIICRNTEKTTKNYVYIGDGKLVHMENGALETADVSVMVKNLSYNYFTALRPTQAYDDINTQVAMPFTDVKKADWFYSFV